MEEGQLSRTQSGQDQEVYGILFPGPKSKSALPQLIEKYYDHSKHQELMINYCYRCHNTALSRTYNQFRVKHQIEIQEPRVSKFYNNQAFFDLRQISPLFDQKVIDHIILPVPKNIKNILDQLFQTFGYIPNLERFLIFYPSYLEKKWSLQQQLFQESIVGKKTAFFLAFCAATQLGSTYMMSRYFKLFKAAGGNACWIRESKFPPKYKALMQLNNTMGRAIWEISQELISSILQSEDNVWSQSELIACIQILAFSHHQSTIALAMGLNIENPQESQQLLEFNQLKQTMNKWTCQDQCSLDCTETLSIVIPNIKEFIEVHKESTVKPLSRLIKQESQDQQIKPYMKHIGQDLTQQTLYQSIHGIFQQILSPFRVINKRRENVNPVVDYSDFNFTFMTYPILNKYTEQTANSLRNLIDYTLEMTKGNFGSSAISNTKEFRKAMVYYSQNLCGYKHMSYNYKQNFGAFLTIAIRFYIKLLTISPSHINYQVIRQINHESGRMECFDLGHVAILIATTKLSLELTLTMRAFQFQ